MGKPATESRAREAWRDGVLIGKCRDHGGICSYEVRFHRGEFVAVEFSARDGAIEGGDIIEDIQELHHYCDDANEAARHWKQIALAREMGICVPGDSEPPPEVPR